jgi:hypothetical protein
VLYCAGKGPPRARPLQLRLLPPTLLEDRLQGGLRGQLTAHRFRLALSQPPLLSTEVPKLQPPKLQLPAGGFAVMKAITPAYGRCT